MNSKIFLAACAIITLLTALIEATSYTKVENIFLQDVYIGLGDVIQCEITKIKEKKHELRATTHPFNDSFFVLTKISSKCVSFKVRAQHSARIIFSETGAYDLRHLEVVLDNNDARDIYYTGIRKFMDGGVYLTKLDKLRFLDEDEYRGFWIRWLDDHLMEIGKESETKPFISYRFSEKLDYNYMGFMTWASYGEWIFDLDPNCAGNIPVQKKITESFCSKIKK